MAKEDDIPEGLPKYKYVEDFVNPETGMPYSVNPETGEPFEPGEMESPVYMKTKFFETVLVHRIAKIKWRAVKGKEEYEVVNDKGETEIKEREIVSYEENMGERGGWVEHPHNLSQSGKCWVKDNAVVCGDARVLEDAEISENAEVGDMVVVRGTAKIGGDVGIVDRVSVGGEAEIDGKKRKAARGDSVVLGKIRDEAYVEDEGIVGFNGVLEDKAVVSERARVGVNEWGPSMVQIEGTDENASTSAIVRDESKCRGECVVEGKVNGKSIVTDNAIVSPLGEIEDVRFSGGFIAGKVEGDGSGKTWGSLPDYLYVSAGAELKKVSAYGGKVSLVVGSRVKMENCAVWGICTVGRDTEIKNCSLERSEIGSHCVIDNRHVEKASVSFYGDVIPESESKSTISDSRIGDNVEIRDSNISNSQVFYGNVTESSVSNSMLVGGCTKKTLSGNIVSGYMGVNDLRKGSCGWGIIVGGGALEHSKNCKVTTYGSGPYVNKISEMKQGEKEEADRDDEVAEVEKDYSEGRITSEEKAKKIEAIDKKYESGLKTDAQKAEEEKQRKFKERREYIEKLIEGYDRAIAALREEEKLGEWLGKYKYEGEGYLECRNWLARIHNEIVNVNWDDATWEAVKAEIDGTCAGTTSTDFHVSDTVVINQTWYAQDETFALGTGNVHGLESDVFYGYTQFFDNLTANERKALIESHTAIGGEYFTTATGIALQNGFTIDQGKAEAAIAAEEQKQKERTLAERKLYIEGYISTYSKYIADIEQSGGGTDISGYRKLVAYLEKLDGMLSLEMSDSLWEEIKWSARRAVESSEPDEFYDPSLPDLFFGEASRTSTIGE